MNESQQSVSGTITDDGHRSRPEAPARPEPAMLHFGRILWQHRVLIVLGSLLPAILVGTSIRLWPVDYTTTFVYERPLAENEYHVLLRRFYSSENLAKIVERLRDHGATDYVTRLEGAETEQALQKLIRFRVSPAYPTRLQTTDPNTSERIGLFKAQLFYIDITGRSKSDMAAVSDVVTANVENVLPIYDIRNDLKESIHKFKKLAVEIEDNRFGLTVDLQKEKTRLEKLSSLAATASEAPEDNLVLQFTDVTESREFLPLPYQKRAVQSKIIDLQETLSSDEEMCGYYLKVLELNGRLLSEIEQSLLTYYTVQEFLDFLTAQLAAGEETELADYLRSLIHKTQNQTLVNTRAGEKPVVYPVSKRMLSRSVLAFLVLLMITTFMAVAHEYGHEQRGHAHPVSGAGPAGG